MERHDILAIRKYISDTYTTPRFSIYSTQFEQWCYSKWAAEKILERVMRYYPEPAFYIVTDFRDKMDQYQYLNPNTSTMFASAVCTADDILCMLMNEGSKRR